MDFPDIVLRFPFLNAYFNIFKLFFLRFDLLKFIYFLNCLVFVFQFLDFIVEKLGLSSAPLPRVEQNFTAAP